MWVQWAAAGLCIDAGIVVQGLPSGPLNVHRSRHVREKKAKIWAVRRVAAAAETAKFYPWIDGSTATCTAPLGQCIQFTCLARDVLDTIDATLAYRFGRIRRLWRLRFSVQIATCR